MNERSLRARDVVLKAMVAHTVTYFVVGLAAFFLLDYRRLLADPSLSQYMRPPNDPMVMAGPLLQPIRGLLFGLVFWLLREPFFSTNNGWLVMWIALAALGIFGTFGAPPGSLEGAIYTVLPLSLHVKLLPEVLLQSFLLSWLVFHWVRHPRRWLNWMMGVAFAVVLILPILGLITNLRQ